jgi:GTP:adenosylcobinamide-phosphate guanylyltransferase
MKTFIIQCGGVGSRMETLTSVKPKALIPIDGKPLIFHLMDNNPNSKFIIITDYCSDVLFKYIKKYKSNENIKFVFSKEKTTSSGIPEALNYVDGPFFIIWSDLYVKQEILEPKTDSISIGLTTNNNPFPCRWSCINNNLIKKSSNIDGVAGLFYIKDKKLLKNIDETKSFTNFLSTTFDKFDTFELLNIEDVGDLNRFYILHKNNRFFNRLTFKSSTVIKEAIIEKYKPLITDEINWYKYLSSKKFNRIPKLISENPFEIEKLNGKNPFNCVPSENFIIDTINTIKSIHSLEKIPVNFEELNIVYNKKTLDRVYDVSDLIPFFDQETIKINNKICFNPFHKKYIELFKQKIHSLYNIDHFTLIHGDCTFSNIISLDDKCYLIDPRGYFGDQKLYGDPRYDWAKLYYSFFGNYDNVNSKKYNIKVSIDSVEYHIDTNGWEKYENLFFDNIGYSQKEIKLLHTLIWFSLCGYVKEDYSSILISFYNAVYLLNSLENNDDLLSKNN